MASTIPDPRSIGVTGTVVALVKPEDWNVESATYWNWACVSTPDGLISAFSVAPVFVTCVADSASIVSGGRVWKLEERLTSPSELEAMTSKS